MPRMEALKLTATLCIHEFPVLLCYRSPAINISKCNDVEFFQAANDGKQVVENISGCGYSRRHEHGGMSVLHS